jgi:uncharacterized protein YndB with AHSA1/START domain
MPSALITSDQDAVAAEVDIAAPPERVFKALTDPAEARQWGNAPGFELKIWEMEARRGGKWRFLCKETSGKANKYNVEEFDHHGEILEIDPPRLLVYTWITNFHDDTARKTVVRWELTPTATGTHLKVTHSVLAQEPKAREDYAGGWPGLLQAIKNHAEKQSNSVVPDQDAIVCQTLIAAPPDRVFQALVDPRRVPQWWGGQGAGQAYRCTKFENELRVGGSWRSSGVTGDGATFEVFGEYLEIDSPLLLVHTWIASWTGDVKTVVRWELQVAEQGTRVTVRHSGLAAHPEIGQSYRAWPRMLSWLQTFLEKGETVEMRQPA